MIFVFPVTLGFANILSSVEVFNVEIEKKYEMYIACVLKHERTTVGGKTQSVLVPLEICCVLYNLCFWPTGLDGHNRMSLSPDLANEGVTSYISFSFLDNVRKKWNNFGVTTKMSANMSLKTPCSKPYLISKSHKIIRVLICMLCIIYTVLITLFFY
jgi:hypothetical protein